MVRNNLNVSAAAEELHTSQPGVSRQVKLLEDELDIRIFERSGKKLTALTPAGHAIFEHVENLLDNARSIEQAAREFSESNRGSLTIATTHTQAQFILPPILRRFSRKYPHIELRVHQGNPRSMGKLAANNQVDFVIASEVIDERSELITIPAYRWNRFVVVPPAHELTRVENISLEELARHPILTYMLGLSGRSQLDKIFDAADLQPRVAFTATKSDVIKTYVRLGLGAGIVAEMACRDDEPDLVYLDASHLFPDSLIKIGFRHSRHISAFQLDFMQMFAPYLDTEVVRKLAATRNREESGELLRHARVPSFRDLSESLSALQAVG